MVLAPAEELFDEINEESAELQEFLRMNRFMSRLRLKARKRLSHE